MTMHRIRELLNNARMTHSLIHFPHPGRSVNNIELIPLELINSNRDGIRKAREAFIISNGKALGMNRRDETEYVYL